MTHADVNIQFIPMTVHGAVVKNEDGSFTLFINANDSMEQRMLTYQHEMDHIVHDDFYEGDSAAAERRANESVSK